MHHPVWNYTPDMETFLQKLCKINNSQFDFSGRKIKKELSHDRADRNESSIFRLHSSSDSSPSLPPPIVSHKPGKLLFILRLAMRIDSYFSSNKDIEQAFIFIISGIFYHKNTIPTIFLHTEFTNALMGLSPFIIHNYLQEYHQLLLNAVILLKHFFSGSVPILSRIK